MKKVFLFSIILSFLLCSCKPTFVMKSGKEAKLSTPDDVSDYNPYEQVVESNENESPTEIFSDAVGQYWFSSGAGAWGTGLTLDKDGAFSGAYGDSDMGVTGESYPNGTHYQSDFNGSFKVEERISEYAYRITINEIEYEKEPATEEIRDGIRHIYTEPAGLNSKTYILYTPDTPVSELSPDCIRWYARHGEIEERETLDTYCIYGEEDYSAFFIYPEDKGSVLLH